MKFHLQTIAAAVAIAVSLPAAAKEYRSSDVHPEDYPTVMAVKYMSDIIKQKTGGKDTIKVYTMSQLGSEKDTIEQTKIGALDFVRINVAPMNNICPETMVPTMPFLFKSKEHMRKVLDGPIGDEILKACEKQGFVGLAFYDSGSRSLYTVKKPVKSIADVKGMKIRVQQSDLWVALLQAMGANATPIPYAEVYTALKTGVVDGAENNWPSYDTARHYEVAKYYAITDHSMAPEMLLMSKKVYDALTPGRAADHPRRGEAVGALHAQAVGREGARVAQEGRGGRRADRRGRQEVVRRRDEARVRQVHHRSEAEGNGAEGAGHAVNVRNASRGRGRPRGVASMPVFPPVSPCCSPVSARRWPSTC